MGYPSTQRTTAQKLWTKTWMAAFLGFTWALSRAIRLVLLFGILAFFSLLFPDNSLMVGEPVGDMSISEATLGDVARTVLAPALVVVLVFMAMATPDQRDP